MDMTRTAFAHPECLRESQSYACLCHPFEPFRSHT